MFPSPKRQHPFALLLFASAAMLSLVGCNGSSSAAPPPTAPPSQGAMFVTDFTNNAVAGWGQNANCNCSPNLLIQGGSTGLSGPIGIAQDNSGNLYVANSSVGTVTKYPGTGNGNVAPSFAIGGLSSPVGVAVDGAKNIYIGNSALGGGTMSVQVYPPGSTVPSQTIAGAATGLSTPGFVTLDGAGNIWVANQSGNNSIEEFPATASGNVTPAAVISGSRTLLSKPQGIAFDTSGHLYVAINNPLGVSDAVLVYSPPLSGNIAPTNILCGPNTSVNNPTGIAVNAQGTLFVVNSAFGVSTGYLTIFASNNIGGGTACVGPMPNAVVGGANSTLINPTGIAL